MSEVRRYDVQGKFESQNGEGIVLVNPKMVLEEDYDSKCHSAEVYFGSWKRTEEERDAAQSELAALREELAKQGDAYCKRVDEVISLQQRLTAAEQRNAELTKAIADAEYRADQGKVWNGMGWTYTGLHSHGQQKVLDILRAALKPTESGASE